jgi:hypothetical protein
MSAAQRPCCICHNLFTPNKFARARQVVCSREPCRKTAKKQRQADWFSRNRDYFCGPENVERVRQWRRKKALESRPVPPSPKPPDPASTQKAKSCNTTEPESGVLQDLARPAEPVIMGLLALWSGTMLQDEVHKLYSQCSRRGSELLGQMVPASGSPITANST